MLRNANNAGGRALRRLLSRAAGGNPTAASSSSSRGISSLIAPVAASSSVRRAALTGARAAGALGGRALAPSSLLPPCAAGLSSRPASTFLTEYDAHVAERAQQARGLHGLSHAHTHTRTHARARAFNTTPHSSVVVVVVSLDRRCTKGHHISLHFGEACHFPSCA